MTGGQLDDAALYLRTAAGYLEPIAIGQCTAAVRLAIRNVQVASETVYSTQVARLTHLVDLLEMAGAEQMDIQHELEGIATRLGP